MCIRDRNSTVVLVTHDIPLALELCPRTVVMKSGKLLCDMKTNEFLSSDSLMKEARVELPFGFELHHDLHHLKEKEKHKH